MLDWSKLPRSTTFVCTSETNLNGLQDLASEYMEALLDTGPLCKIREADAGRGGSVDFLAFDCEGRVFLIEVKRAKDQRAKFDVIFQELKYYCSPQSILNKLTAADFDFTAEVSKQLKLDSQAASRVAAKALKNIEAKLINLVIITDEATYPLIGHAYTFVLRHTKSEVRVIEVNVQHVEDREGASPAQDFVYIRRYRSSREWVGGKVTDNRKPTEYGSLNDALGRVPNQTVALLAARLMEMAGIRPPRPAKTTKYFTLIQSKAYFSWDPNGDFTNGMYEATPEPRNPYRIVVKEESPDIVQHLANAGSREEKSRHGKYTYRVFDLTEDVSDTQLRSIAEALRELNH